MMALFSFPCRPSLLLLAMTLLASALGACVPTPRVQQAMPEYEGVGDTDRKWTQRERLLARSDFSVEIVKLTDDRRPRSQAKEPDDKLLYAYLPEQLLGGVTYRLPVLFSKYMAYRPQKAKHYLVEIEVLKLRTVIAAGTLFVGGSNGRYQMEMDVIATARRPDSTVAVKRLYRVALEQARVSYNGRSPSAELDRSRMYDLVDDGVRELSERIGWDIRQKDARHWRMKPVPPAPARVERVTPSGETSALLQREAPLPAGKAQEVLTTKDPLPVVIQPTSKPLPENVNVK